MAYPTQQASRAQQLAGQRGRRVRRERLLLRGVGKKGGDATCDEMRAVVLSVSAEVPAPQHQMLSAM